MKNSEYDIWYEKFKILELSTNINHVYMTNLAVKSKSQKI